MISINMINNIHKYIISNKSIYNLFIVSPTINKSLKIAILVFVQYVVISLSILPSYAVAGTYNLCNDDFDSIYTIKPDLIIGNIHRNVSDSKI